MFLVLCDSAGSYIASWQACGGGGLFSLRLINLENVVISF